LKKRGLGVMHVILDLTPDGAQQNLRTLVEYQSSDNCVPIVCTFKGGPLQQDIEQLGVKVEMLPSRRYSVFAFPWFVDDMTRIWRSLARLVRQYDVDVVQTHLLSVLDFLVLLLRYATQVRVVLWTFQNSDFGIAEDQLRHKWLLKPKRYVHNLLYRMAFPLVDGYIAVSDEVKQAMVREIGPIEDKITVICNAVDVKRYGQSSVDKAEMRNRLGFSADDRLVAVVGRLHEQKGHCYLIEAMTTVVPRYPNVHALFIGEGHLRDELQAQAERLGLGQHVHFLGRRHDIPDLLAVSELFVLPSLWEGLSVALLEAMAAGKPIVATSVSGTDQVVRPGETGLVVPPRDAQAIADATMRLLADPVQAQVMGQAARRRVTLSYGAQKLADEHLELYHRLLENAS
jgi:glycosyltransferase involved in cell wall biosynthesis